VQSFPEVKDLQSQQWTVLKMTGKAKQHKETWYTLRGSGIYCTGASAHRPTVVVKTASGPLDTNQHTNVLFYII